MRYPDTALVATSGTLNGDSAIAFNAATYTVIVTATGNASPLGYSRAAFEVLINTIAGGTDVLFQLEATNDGTNWFVVDGELLGSTAGSTDVDSYEPTFANAAADQRRTVEWERTYLGMRLSIKGAGGVVTGTASGGLIRH